jgi:predicted secreted Zn-dependent protease
MLKHLSLFVLIIIVLIVFSACAPAATPVPIPSPTATAAPTSTPVPSAIPTATLTPAATSTSIPTPVPTATATRTLPAPATVISGLVIPNAKIVYYDIVGSTETELRAQMDALGPIDIIDNKRADSAKVWKVTWNWTGYGTNTCDLKTAVVSYEVTVTLPRWKPPAGVSTALITKWNNFVLARAEHEKGHVDHIASHYQAVLTAIKGATCQTADGAAQETLQGLRKFDQDYDDLTFKGATQGGKFP